ncbi:SDR family NAD(P)-dependent oxidoreductase [Streptomyces sp. NPDC057474]|uniref:SDR family NAD(P)-dependent oxidoreductase n=1 Tax=Streptomyces sp. NPDC057474 TaxID=3346144 RepID=UPI0036C3926A
MLDGRVAIVAGAGSGLKRAYAHAPATVGAAVVVHDLDADVAAETVDTITAAGGSDFADALVRRAVDEFGRLDVMITNAGRAPGQHPAQHRRRGAIIAMMRTWAVELAKIDVTVNAVAPTALTRTAATMPRLGGLVAKADAGESIPEGTRRQGLGSPDDVAPLIVYLASKDSGHVTGQAIAAGGDRIALWTHPGEVAEQLRPGGWTIEAVSDLFA